MAQSYPEPCSRGLLLAEPCPEELGREIAPARRRWVLAACVLASSMAFIDGSALTVALPRLRADLGVDLAAVQWVLNGYVVALASFTLIGGALADVWGKGRVLALGCLLFGAASAACALAPNLAWLILARVVQGLAAALIAPSSLALIGAVYPKAERNRAIGVWAAASALTTAGGPVLGGWLTETFGWPAIFWINPPLALAAVALLVAFAPAEARQPRSFDLLGAAILAAALAVLAWALVEIGHPAEAGGSSSGASVAVALAVAVAGMIGYALWERASDHPMTPPRLVSNRAFFALNLATFLLYGALSIALFVLPFDLVDRRGLAPTDAGLVFLPFTLGVGLLSRAFGGLSDTLGARIMLIAGGAAAALAYLWMALGRALPLIPGVVLPMALLGVAFALIAAPITAAVLSSVDEADEGLASGINNWASRIAQLAGVALAAGIASLAAGFALGFAAAVLVSLLGAATIMVGLSSAAATKGTT